MPEKKDSLQKLFLPVSGSFHFTRLGNAMFTFIRSRVRFELSRRARLALFSPREIPRYTNIAAAGVTLVQKVLHEFIFARGTIGNNFVSKLKMSV